YIPKEVKETGEVLFETKLIKMKTEPDEAEKLWKKALKLLAGPCPPRHEEEGERCAWCELISIE
ncbi:MAG: hypothetical protein NTZ83_02400, partial [Candidatus Pacearchaeota archaeon]|nr:hypothetical protein [Candidatus Pacearchaeota archaeon]